MPTENHAHTAEPPRSGTPVPSVPALLAAGAAATAVSTPPPAPEETDEPGPRPARDERGAA